ncbi:MAG: bacteriohemerythrin [Actinobacteria bacterium]|nr:bacteriohemerythrin [Actinomycetota bacterium]MBM2827574.1 bacteriohemerythrin [Actinomycetota bacterium]
MTTSLFKWKNDFSVGIKELDDQHRSFFEILNRLGEAAGRNKGIEVVGLVLQELNEYSRHHFAEEENWLRVVGFPGLQFQKKQHEFFISQVTDLLDKYSKGDANLPISTMEFLRDWLLSHILENDKKYGTYMHDVRE